MLADAAVSALAIQDKLTGLSKWLPFSKGHSGACSAGEVARLACAFAMAAPEASAVLEAAAAAPVLRQTEDDEAWRRTAWACAVRHPQPEIFGIPDTQASESSSRSVWAALETLKGRLETADNTPLFFQPHWLSPEEASTLMAAANACDLWEASPLAEKGASAPSRTSESAVLAAGRGLPRRAQHVAAVVSERAARCCGLPRTHLEPLQLVRYSAGQYYAPHVDWGGPEDASLWLSGQRVATVLAYLNDLPYGSGGATNFPRLGVRVAPAQGAALIWPNVDGTGQPLDAVLHEAEPLVEGTAVEKIALNIWIRDRPTPGLA